MTDITTTSFDLATLVPVTEHHALAQGVDGRALHAWLQNGDKFSTWARQRIRQHGFTLGRDYETFSDMTEKRMGRPPVEFVFSVGAAKLIAASARTARGQEAREYLVAVEQSIVSAAPAPNRNAGTELARVDLDNMESVHGLLAALAARRVEDERTIRSLTAESLRYAEGMIEAHQEANTLRDEVAELEPRAQFYNDYMAAPAGSYTITQAAKILNVKPHSLSQALRDAGLVAKRPYEIVPSSRAVEAGYMVSKSWKRETDYGDRAGLSTHITARGLEWLAKLIRAGKLVVLPVAGRA